MPTDPDPLNIGDDANPTPSGDPDPVTIAPDLARADNDCDDEDDRAWSDEPDGDDEFVKVRRGEDFECDDEIEESWSWTGDPLIAVFDSAKGAMAGADRYYDQRLDWWEEEPEYWMAHRPLGFNDVRDEDDERADPDGDGLADSEGVDYRTDDCDDVTPCWCGETDPLYDDEGLDATCDGSGTLICHCGGDLCVCHHHGETECPGCEHCAELEGDDDGPFEDGDELDGESGEACYRCGSTVDVGRYHGRWICDDCDDNEEDCDDA